MSTPLESAFASARGERALLIGYVPAGFPTMDGCKRIISAMVAGGVDVIEVGFPYSDPVMDGPVIQAAADLALSHGVGAEQVFEILRHAATLVPSVIMTYWNPIERYGVKKFASSIIAAGGSGTITPDLTIEESEEWISSTREAGANRIYVVAQTTNGERLKRVVEQSSGFIYAASLMGVTGVRTSISSGAKELVSRLREVTDTPVAVGLGVSNEVQAAEVAEYADGVIVGSAFIRAVQESETIEAAEKAVRELAEKLSAGVRSAKR